MKTVEETLKELAGKLERQGLVPALARKRAATWGCPYNNMENMSQII
jgi:hypothetical protein